jgi:hypothetical protein
MKYPGLKIAFSLIFACLSGQRSAFAEPQAGDLERARSWLPSDTETVFVAKGPFTLPAAFPTHEPVTDKATDQEVDLWLQCLPIALLDIGKGHLLRQLKGQQVDVAIEGSRHARPPAGLGEQPYEGAAIVVFDPGSQITPNTVLESLQGESIRTEEIQGTHVLVFQETMEEDLWTTYVAFPEKDVLVVATNRDYLEEVLTRRKSGDAQKRALPDSLPEWRLIDQKARYFGMRHYDRNQAKSDPSSPFGGKKAANFPDERAIGFAFSIGTTNPRRVTMTYFSGDLAMTPEQSPFRILATAPEAHNIDSQFRSVGAGVVQLSCSFKTVEGLDFFVFLLEGFMGHAIYL